jgi:hypothetical protein
MNTRSIRFRLTVWYAGLLAGMLILFGLVGAFDIYHRRTALGRERKL